MRRNLLHWCNLVLISKILMFYEFGLVRTYQYLADLLQKKIMTKNSELKFSKYMQNLSRSKRFGKFVLIVGDNCPFKKDIYRGIPMVHLAPLVSPGFPLVSPWFPWFPPALGIPPRCSHRLTISIEREHLEIAYYCNTQPQFCLP